MFLKRMSNAHEKNSECNKNYSELCIKYGL